jgi:signal transduction histidine kinase
LPLNNENTELIEKIEKMYQSEQQDKLVISVLDTGIGIKDKDQKQLFKMFGTLKNTQQMNTNGIGLGLFIC